MKIIAHILRIIVILTSIFSMVSLSFAQSSSSRIFSMSWNPDGTLLAVGIAFGNNQRALRFFNQEGQLVQQYDVTSGGPSGVSWRYDNNQVAFRGGASQYMFLDVETNTVSLTFLQSRDSDDNSIYWNPSSSSQLANVVADVIEIRDANTGELQQTLDADGGRPDYILGMGWSFDGSKIYTGSTDNVIRVWDVATGTLDVEVFVDYPMTAFAMSPDATQIAISSGGDYVRIYDISDDIVLCTKTEKLPQVPKQSPIGFLAWSPDGQQIVGSTSKYIYVLDITSGNIIASHDVSQSNRSLDAMAYRRDGALTFPVADSDFMTVRAGNELLVSDDK